jgi:GntR family transcriptional regulator/MocR family aminotransferase
VDHLAGTGVRAVLLTPAHQFPTGVVLAPQRRRELLDWAAAADALIIEDDYDAEYRYDRAPVPALQASAPGQVAYAGSTSKTLAPGMRLGWLIPPVRLHADLVEAKHASDLGSPALPQLVLAHLIATGELEQHIRGSASGSAAGATRCSARCASSCPRPACRASPPGCTCSSRSRARAGQVDDTELAERVSRPGCWSTRCPGTVSGPGRPGSCSATPPTRPISCARRPGASRRSSRLSVRGRPAPPCSPPRAGRRSGDGAGPPSAAG